jgi:hypothetical protein
MKIFLFLFIFYHVESFSTFSAELLINKDQSCTKLTEIIRTQQHRLLSLKSPIIKELKAKEHFENFESEEKIIIIYAISSDLVRQAVQKECNGQSNTDWVFPVVSSGDSSNRVDLVFMGDGYTKSQKKLFRDDIERLVDDMFRDVTFASYLPLLNIWGLFRESAESGIGVGGRPKNTAFGLYRDGTELRGVYCSKQSNALSACRSVGPYACDYPTLIGNDQYYGGLGGQFVISTSSHTSGTVVLRHELGHNLVQVGEEYDGGQVYSGVNSAASLNRIGWSHWLTDPKNIREELSRSALQAYPWFLLNKNNYWTKTFSTDGTFKRFMIQFSYSGAPDDDSIVVLLDGKRLEFKSKGVIDRSFFTLQSKVGFSKGTHSIRIEKGPGRSTSLLQLCNIQIMEYMDEDLFVMEHKIGAYPTISQYGTKKYRPMNEYCLMRNMSSSHFCPVCQEGLWLSLLRRVSIIDNVDYTCINEDEDVTFALVNLSTIKLGQFRSLGKGSSDERINIRWYFNDLEELDLRDRVNVTLYGPLNQWRVTADLTTSEIRRDSKVNFFINVKMLTKSSYSFKSVCDTKKLVIQD